MQIKTPLGVPLGTGKALMPLKTVTKANTEEVV